MKNSFALLAFSSVAFAFPAPDTSGSCINRTDTNGPAVTTPTDSAEVFLAFPEFALEALSAAVPAGYALVPEFQNLHAAASDSSYKTYTTDGVDSYDPSICAAKCDAMDGCVAFNIFYERVPLTVNPATLVPDATLCPADADSPSATIRQCAFYGAILTESMATNVGQFWGTFPLVIAGSNAYVKSGAPTVSGWEGPVGFAGGINAPAPVNEHGYLRSETFGMNVDFDPSLCVASCQNQTTFNEAHADQGEGPCVFFNIYTLEENGADGVLTCVYFSTPYGPSYATFTGQYDQQGDFFGVTNSYGYYLNGSWVP